MASGPSLTHFYIRRLHSLTGLLMGLFLCEHMVTNQFANLGADKYNDVIHTMMGLPFIKGMEVAVLLFPFAFHILYGCYILVSSSPNVLAYGYNKNWNYLWQRITAVLALFFILAHVIGTRFIALVEDPNRLIPVGDGMLRPWKEINHAHISFEHLSFYLRDFPALQAVYVVGLLACTFHFANGLWTFAITWGITVGKRSQQVWGWCCVAIFLGLSALGLNGLNAFVGWWPPVTF